VAKIGRGKINIKAKKVVVSNYPKDWAEERIKIWENDLDLISQIMGLFYRMSPGGRRKMAYILRITVEGLEEEKRELEEEKKNEQ
jgi:hypothetical protein